MGWKSTKTITREEAVRLLMAYSVSAPDEKLAHALESIGFGEDQNLPYYGHNFRIGEEEPKEE